MFKRLVKKALDKVRDYGLVASSESRHCPTCGFVSPYPSARVTHCKGIAVLGRPIQINKEE